MIEAMPIAPGAMPYQPPTGANGLDLLITLVVLVPLLSAAWDIMVKAWRDEI